ncbi:AmpG family muropeptide MFS transporter [Fulvivirga sp. M361]|uniref:MFS transporter n=1 Tax=Fulvivirga sp. M361 TaxID=2594266 RepID=UPI00117A8C03|nr:MFS transporter [Fulvivirga sp. M361]TRX50929.1 AmpG family muropeptide MFS transporter [Fulvivirga sp. M361]
MAESRSVTPWRWVPSLYYAEAFPYVIVTVVSVIMYKRLELSNTEIALYTSWFYLPWVIKPFWSPIVDLKSTKRKWLLFMQLAFSIAILGTALALQFNAWISYTLFFFWLAAFSSATHDIAADGFYMIGLKEEQQSFFIGVRSTFYRLALITGQGLVVILAGYLEESLQDNRQAWSITLACVAGIMFLLTLYNFWSIPKKESVEKAMVNPMTGFFDVFITFFQKKHIVIAIAYILLYRLGESQLVKMASPFLLDDTSAGGLALSTQEVGFIYGTLGLISLSLGGILGGFLISRDGLGKWIWKMALALNLPNVLYVLLAYFQPQQVEWVMGAVVVEQFGYGFGFTSFMLYLIYIAEGETKTAHYAIGTGLMALGMMLPGMVSGYLQESMGYRMFFVWVVIAAVPGIYIIRHLSFPGNYGKKETENSKE